MSARSDRFWQERVALQYLDALDAGDLDAVALLWEQAATDPELEALLSELNEGLDVEEGPGTAFSADASRVFDLARQHLPSAFPPVEDPGPLTAAEVARRLEAEPEFRRIDPTDRATHARLLAEAASIPDDLGQPGFDRWMQGLGIVASPTYRRAFRRVAVLMDMARCQQEGRLAAARKAPSAPADPKGGAS
jgi:hypothetical protein